LGWRSEFLAKIVTPSALALAGTTRVSHMVHLERLG
jgi:hypothetical protein